MKSWKVKHVLPLIPKQLCSCGDLLAIAGETELLVYNPDTQKILWQLTYERQSSFNNHEPVYSGGHLIASFIADEKEELAWVFALHPQTGELIWKEKVPHRCLTGRNLTDNYLVATTHHLFYTQRKEGQSWLRNAKTGSLVTTLPGFQVERMESNSRFIALYEWEGGDILLLDTEAETPVFTAHNTGELIDDFRLDENVITVLVGDEDDGLEDIHIRQYSLPEMELVREFTFPDFLNEGKLVDVRGGNQVYVTAEDSIHGVDLEKGILAYTFPAADDPAFVSTQHGISVFPFMGEAEMRSNETGELLAALEDKGFQYPFLQIGDDVLCEGSWLEIESLKNPDVCEHTLWLSWQEEDETLIGEPKGPVTTPILERLGVSGPRKASLADQLKAAKEQLTSDGDWEAFFAEVATVFKIAALQPDVKAFLQELQSKGSLSGAIGTGKFDSVVGGFTYDNLWSMGPDDQFFPGLLIASESGGHYFYVHLETAELMCVHHDDNYDWASNWESILDEQDAQGFAKAMFANPLFTLKAWREFDTGFGELDQDDLRSLEEEEPEQFFRLLQKATGWTFDKIYDKMWCHELNVLTYGDENYELLKELS